MLQRDAGGADLMGYHISLNHDVGIEQVPRHNDGSMRQYGWNDREGTMPAEISVTGNYDPIYQQVTGKSLKEILGAKPAWVTVPVLNKVVTACGTLKDDDYLKATPGNAGAIAALLLDWARLHPEAMWKVST